MPGSLPCGSEQDTMTSTVELVEAEPRFRRVRGYTGLHPGLHPDLRYPVAALDALAPPDGAVADVA